MSASVVQAIQETLDTYCVEEEQASALRHALSQPGFALHPDAPYRAANLTLACFQAVSPRLNRAAVLGAAAVELHMEAAYLYDDVADEGAGDPDRFSPAEKLALAIALQSCGSAAATEAAALTGSAHAHRAVVRFHQHFIGACAGQFLDATYDRHPDVALEDAIRMTQLKSGSLGRFAAEFGASLGISESNAIRLCGDVGFNLFTYAQLVDDLKDAFSADGQEDDFSRNKKTAPVVFFQKSSPRCSDNRQAVGCGLQGHRSHREAKEEYNNSGASTFGIITAEVFLNRAKEALRQMEGYSLDTTSLAQLVRSVESASRNVV